MSGSTVGREQIAAIMSTDLRTSDNWLAETGTQEFGLAPSNNTNGSLTKHPGVPSSTFRRAQERVAFLRRRTEDARAH